MLKNNFTNLFTQWFEKPKVSVFDLSKPVSTDVQIGKWYPTFWTICGFGDSEKGRSTHKMRLAPMLAPNFSDLRVNEHTIVVPLRVIMRDYEAKFNYSKNRDGASLPTFSVDDLVSIYKAMGTLGVSPIGSLFDFLGFPVFGDYYKSLVASSLQYIYVNSSSSVAISSIIDLPIDVDLSATTSTDFYAAGLIKYRGVTYNLSQGDQVLPLFLWAIRQYRSSVLDDDFTIDDLLVQYAFFVFSNLDTNDLLGSFVRWLGDDLTIVSLVDSYYSYLFTSTLYKILSSIDIDSSYTILPFLAYHRCVADWSLVSNVTDPDTYLQTHVYDFKTNVLEFATRLIATGDDVDPLTDDEKALFIELVSPKDRLWDLDFFTSMLPESAQGEDILIPANSTVIDLAKLTAFQKLIMRLSFSSRYRDVVWNVFNIRPSDARLQQSSVIQSNQYFVQIGETVQTSETSVSSVLGNFAGRGYSAGTKKGYHIFCEEPCVVMNFYSLVCKPRYADALHPLIHLDDIFDFPIPDMDVLGNQPLPTDLLTGNPNDTEIFGYSRQYMEWLKNYGTVHNRMKTSLDYWTLSRRFDSEPALNEEFLTINPKDDYDRIFSVPDSSHAMLDIYYDILVTRPVRRSVRILI